MWMLCGKGAMSGLEYGGCLNWFQPSTRVVGAKGCLGWARVPRLGKSTAIMGTCSDGGENPREMR